MIYTFYGTFDSREATSQVDMLACTFGDCRGVFDLEIACRNGVAYETDGNG